MLSSSFNIAEFIEKVKGRSLHDIIWMTDQEATEAERCLYKRCHESERDQIASYTGCLKDFVVYVRHGVRTSDTRELELDAFRNLRMQKYRPTMAVSE